MRIACPACAAAYEVPEDRLAPGRTVRCALCDTEWRPVPAVPEPAVEPTVEPPAERSAEPSPGLLAEASSERVEPVGQADPVPAAAPVMAGALHDPAGTEPARRRASPILLSLAWLLSVAILAGAAWGAVVERDRVMRGWPPSIRAYRALGLAPSATQAPEPAPHH